MDSIQNNSTLEEKSEHKNFFSKRNIILIIITTVLSLGLMAVTVLFIIDMNWINFFKNIGSGLAVGHGVLWFVLLLLFMAFAIAYNYLYIWIRLRRLGIKIPALQYFTFSLSIAFLKGVTPSNFVYDPYTIFWLKTQGVSTSRATSIMFSNALLWQAVQLLIHIPSFIIVMMKADLVLQMNAGGVALIVFMSIGLFVDVIGCLLMVLLCFSKRSHFVLSSIFNWFKKKLHMKYHTKAEIEKKYKTKATIKREVIDFYRNWIDTSFIIVILVAYELADYYSIATALALINGKGDFILNAKSINYIYHSANMAFNANRLNIIPAFGVGLEASLLGLINVLGGIQTTTGASVDEFVKEGVFLWRSFDTFFPALFGLFAFGGLTIYHIKSYKKKHGSFLESKYE